MTFVFHYYFRDMAEVELSAERENNAENDNSLNLVDDDIEDNFIY